MNFIEQKLQNYLHLTLVLIEDSCMLLIASDNIERKIKIGLEIGNLCQAAALLHNRIYEMFDKSPPRKCTALLHAEIQKNRKAEKEIPLLAILKKEMNVFIQSNRKNIIMQRDVDLLKSVLLYFNKLKTPGIIFTAKMASLFEGNKIITPPPHKKYADILKSHPFPGRQANLRQSEEKIFNVATNDELVSDLNQLKPFLHYVMIDVEISATEICSYNILRYQRMPVAFLIDMARQIWDEARHASIIKQMLHELGAKTGDYSYSNIVLKRYLKATSLEESIAIQQLLQEGNAVEINMLLVKAFRKKKWNRWADIFSVINIDEGLHARMGNKWMQFLLGKDYNRKFTRILKRASRKIDIPVYGKGGWNPEVRKQIGFPPGFIAGAK